MFELKFKGAFGEETKNISISFANGSGGGTLHLFFDKYYKGIIILREGKWAVLFQLYTDAYTMDDLDALIEIVETNFNE